MLYREERKMEFIDEVCVHFLHYIYVFILIEKIIFGVSVAFSA